MERGEKRTKRRDKRRRNGWRDGGEGIEGRKRVSEERERRDGGERGRDGAVV